MHLASRRTLSLVALALLAGLTAVALPARSADDEDDTKARATAAAAISKLIDQLGDDDQDVRTAAEKKLTDAGESALVAIRKAASGHADPDVRLRCIILSGTLGKKLYGEIRKMAGHTEPIRHIAVSKDGKAALTGSMDTSVREWDLATGKQLKKLGGHTSWTWQVAYSPDGKKALSSGGMDKTMRLWDLADDGKEERQFTGNTDRVYGAAFSPDGKQVVSGGAGGDTSLRIFDVKTGKELHKLEGHKGWVWKVVYSPDGKKIASAGCNDFTFRVWEAETGRPLYTVDKAHEEGYVVGIAFSPDSKHILTSGRDQTCKLWDAENGKLVRTYTGPADNVEAVAFSRDGKRFLAGETGVVHVFETDTGKVIHRFEEHEKDKKIFAVAFLPDGTKALSGGEDKVLRLWGVPR